MDADYTISYVSGTLNVTPASLTITADNKTKVYGAALPTLTASYSGFVNGDTSASLTTLPSFSTTATAASHVSGNPYAITASGAVDADYTISYVSGTLNVTPASLTITADSKSKVYGSALPTLTASYTRFCQRRYFGQSDYTADPFHHCHGHKPYRNLFHLSQRCIFAGLLDQFIGRNFDRVSIAECGLPNARFYSTRNAVALCLWHGGQ